MALTEEGRKKISELHKGREPWNKGKKISDKQKEKISTSLLARGKKKSTEQVLLGKTDV